jgi:amidase
MNMCANETSTEGYVMTELWKLSAGEMAQRVASKDVSSRELVVAHLERIAAVNGQVNAVTAVLADSALIAADIADLEVRTGELLGPLHGVPFTVKENIDLTGSATTQGVRAFAHAIATVDAPVSQRMKSAGAIPIARTNMPDFGLRVHTFSDLHGVTNNPWNLAHTTAGSSGGEAAALAAGMSPIGLGNDVGGSLRNPAHCCGVSSLKPTQHTVPFLASMPPQDPTPALQMMATDGPMARSIRDVEIGYRIIGGFDHRDPWSTPAGPEVPANSAKPRVAVMADVPGLSVHRDVAAGVRRAGEALAAQGYEVIEAASPSIADVYECWSGWLMSELAMMAPLLDMVMGSEGKQFLAASTKGRSALSMEEYATWLVRRRELGRLWATFLAEYPLLLCPVWTQPAPHHGFDLVDDNAAQWVLQELMPCVLPGNLLGLPAAVVPVGMSGDLPVGVQIYAGRFGDHLALSAGAVIEDAVAAAGMAFGPIDPRG